MPCTKISECVMSCLVYQFVIIQSMPKPLSWGGLTILGVGLKITHI